MKFLRSAALLLTASVLFTSCVKNTYDSPPDTSMSDPNLPVNTTLSTFSSQALNMAVGQYRTLGDTTICGVVTADDKTGNFYKQIVIQDSTSAIAIGLDKTYIYNDYPIGRRVYIKLNGLILINYKGLPIITGSVDAAGKTTGIPTTLVPNYVIKGKYPVTVTPTEVSITDLFSNSSKYYNQLIKFKNVQFDDASKGQVYAASTASGSFATSRTITDCAHTANMVMYNSAYATFQPYITPTGNGDLVCICSFYNSIQLLIRDTTDVTFTGPRCP